MTSGGGDEAAGELPDRGPRQIRCESHRYRWPDFERFVRGVDPLLLKDEKPLVRIVEPFATSFATPDAMVKVLAVAEDDYGILETGDLPQFE